MANGYVEFGQGIVVLCKAATYMYLHYVTMKTMPYCASFSRHSF